MVAAIGASNDRCRYGSRAARAFRDDNWHSSARHSQEASIVRCKAYRPVNSSSWRAGSSTQNVASVLDAMLVEKSLVYRVPNLLPARESALLALSFLSCKSLESA